MGNGLHSGERILDPVIQLIDQCFEIFFFCFSPADIFNQRNAEIGFAIRIALKADGEIGLDLFTILAQIAFFHLVMRNFARNQSL